MQECILPAYSGFSNRDKTVAAEGQAVAKWGNWHCGEDKAQFETVDPSGRP
jgi:hypothetical protein